MWNIDMNLLLKKNVHCCLSSSDARSFNHWLWNLAYGDSISRFLKQNMQQNALSRFLDGNFPIMRSSSQTSTAPSLQLQQLLVLLGCNRLCVWRVTLALRSLRVMAENKYLVTEADPVTLPSLPLLAR